MDQNQVYLIKSGSNSFVETESEITIGINGGKLGIGTTSPEAYLHVTGNTQIDGDLTVKGNFTTVDSTTIQVDDKNIELGVGSTTDAAADGGGITLHGATNKTFNWIDATDAWTSSENLYIADGKHFAGDELRALDSAGLKLFDNNASGITVKAGKVGVHSANPVYDLDVVGSGNFGSLYVGGNSVLTGTAADLGKWSDGSTAGEIYYNGGNVGINTSDPAYTLDVAGGGNFNSLTVQGNNVLTGSAADLSRWSDGSTAGEIYYNGGNVGINTNDPSTTLDVNGSLNVEGSFTVREQFDFGSNGAVGGVSPAAVDDIIKWNGTKWVAGANPGGAGAGGGEVPSALINGLISGQSVQSIAFLDTYDTAPRIATELEIDGEGSIIPYVISGVSTTGYNLIFSQEIPNNNYKIHTVFGGKDVYWETGASNSLSYNDGDVSLQRNLTIGGNLTVNGTQTIVNTETIEIEDHNLVIGANTHYTGFNSPYPGAGDAYAGILWGTGDAGAASSVGLTYQSNKGFAFEGGNVGIGTTSPGVKLTSIGTSGLPSTTGTDQPHGLFRVENAENQVLDFGVDAGGPAWMQATASDGLGWVTDLAINPNGGNVGIGTASPDVKLHLAGNASSIIRLENTDKSLPADRIIGGLEFEKQDASAPGAGVVGGLRMYSADQFGQSTYLALSTTSTTSLDQEAMRITSTGNVGIGTTSPGVKLTSRGTSGLPSTTGADQPHGLFRVENAENQVLDFGVDAGGPAWMQATASDGLSWVTDLAINPNGGNVGIGTTSPGAKLEVFQDLDTSSGASILKVTNTRVNTGSSSSVISLITDEVDGSTADERVQLAGSYDGINGGKLDILTNNGSSLSPAVTIKHNGNVGIGTTNPVGKLQVNDFQLISGFTVQTTATGITVQTSADMQGVLSNGDTVRISGIVYTITNLNSTTFQLNTPATISGSGLAIYLYKESLAIKDGNVGIGTTSPSAKLDVFGSNSSLKFTRDEGDRSAEMSYDGTRFLIKAPSGDRLSISDSSSNELLTVNPNSGNVGIGATSPSARLEVIRSDQNETESALKVFRGDTSSGNRPTAPILNVFNGEAGGTEVFRVQGNGNVGIGTTNPGAQLEVANSSNTEVTSKFYNGGGSAPATVHIIEDGNASDHVGLFVGANDLSSAVLITKQNNVGIGTTNPGAKLHIQAVSGPAGSINQILKLTTGTTVGAYLSTIRASATNDVAGLVLGVNTTNALTIKDGGNVGIGTTNPGSYKLYVNGNAFSSGTWGTSDDRVKHNEQPIIGALETLSKITPKKYIKTLEMYDADHDFELDADGNPIDSNGEPVEHRIEAGVIAQQVLTVDELAFAVSPEGVDQDGTVTSPHGLDYNSLFTYAIAAIQEQQQLIDDLKSQNESLAARISALES